MILSDTQMRKRLGDSIVIDPFNPANVNTASYDVTLGEWYYVEQKPSWWLFGPPIYNIWDFDHVKAIWGRPRQADVAIRAMSSYRRWSGIDPHFDRVILIPPKHTILAHTQEFIGGRASIKSLDTAPSTTKMHARSSFGRNFIEVCKCAGLGDVGYINRWTMEITNNSRFYAIPLVVGRRIAQIQFAETGPVVGRYGADDKYQIADLDIESLKSKWHPEMMLPRLDKDRDTPTTVSERCRIMTAGDRTSCLVCGQQWDTNDPAPPKCRRAK